MKTSETNALYDRAERFEGRIRLYTLAVVVLAAVTVLFVLRDNRRQISAEGEHDFPVAYSALPGSASEVSPSDVELRADSYIAQFREFDRTYCFEYWIRCQELLSEDPDYAPDEELTARAREDYLHYILLMRTAAEERRAMIEKIILCGTSAALTVIAASVLCVAILRRVMLLRRIELQEWKQGEKIAKT